MLLGPETLYEILSSRFAGGNQRHQAVKSQPPDIQKALLLKQLAALPLRLTYDDLTMWHFYLESGKTLLPRAGGLYDQRAGEMEKLRLLDTAFSLVRALIDLAEDDRMKIQGLPDLDRLRLPREAPQQEVI